MMFTVCVTRTYPYVEDLWYEFDTLEEAMDFAIQTCSMQSVDEVTVYDEDENVVDVFN